jgi:NAD(P)-dependent dehydrogenase (short-subunit alcohol dehydrogenase family)
VAPLDVADEASRQAFAAEVAALHPALDLLVNNAGVLPPGERFGALDARVLEHTLQVNTIAPLMLAQSLAPLLARGTRPRVFNLSSRLGSMALADAFRTPSYNISKAALNMATVMMARALNPMGIGVLAASPGWVRTDMGGEKAPVTAGESVHDLLAMLERRADPGAGEFVDRDGAPLPW